MQDFITRLFALVTSLEFIVGTLICGLILSVAGAALYDWGKALLGRFSARQRAKNEREKQQIERLARNCIENPSYLNIRIGDANYWLIGYLGCFVIASIFGCFIVVLEVVVYHDSIVRYLNSDAIELLGSLSIQSSILQIPVTRTDLWFRLFILAAVIGVLFLYRMAYIYSTRSLKSRRVVGRAWKIILDQTEASTNQDQNDA